MSILFSTVDCRVHFRILLVEDVLNLLCSSVFFFSAHFSLSEWFSNWRAWATVNLSILIWNLSRHFTLTIKVCKSVIHVSFSFRADSVLRCSTALTASTSTTVWNHSLVQNEFFCLFKPILFWYCGHLRPLFFRDAWLAVKVSMISLSHWLLLWTITYFYWLFSVCFQLLLHLLQLKLFYHKLLLKWLFFLNILMRAAFYRLTFSDLLGCISGDWRFISSHNLRFTRLFIDLFIIILWIRDDWAIISFFMCVINLVQIDDAIWIHLWLFGMSMCCCFNSTVSASIILSWFTSWKWANTLAPRYWSWSCDYIRL